MYSDAPTIPKIKFLQSKYIINKRTGFISVSTCVSSLIIKPNFLLPL